MHDNWYDDYTGSEDAKPEAEGGSLILGSEHGNFVILQHSKEMARMQLHQGHFSTEQKQTVHEAAATAAHATELKCRPSKKGSRGRRQTRAQGKKRPALGSEI